MWHHLTMGWKEFTASVIGDVLSWPVVAFIVVLLLLKPLRELVGRIKSAKGFGGEVEFDDLIEGIEEFTDKAIEDSPVDTEALTQDESGGDSPPDTGEGQRLADEETHAGRDDRISPAMDPSAAILGAWKSLISTLSELSRIDAGRGRPARNPTAIIKQVREAGLFSTPFFVAVNNLQEMRNRVAHGEDVPTVGAAMTFVDRANQLESMAKGQIAIAKMDLDKPIIGGR